MSETAMEHEVAKLRRDLAAAQAFNDCLSRHVFSLIETTKKKGAPNAATLVFACEESLRKAWQAGVDARTGR